MVALKEGCCGDNQLDLESRKQKGEDGSFCSASSAPAWICADESSVASDLCNFG